MAADYGYDISCTTDMSATLQDVTGEQLLREVACRRLFTPNKSLLSAPDEETCDLRLFLSGEQDLSGLNLDVIKSTIVSALKADQRFDTVEVAIDWIPGSSYMEVSVKGFGGLGPFSLTLGVNAVTIEVLR